MKIILKLLIIAAIIVATTLTANAFQKIYVKANDDYTLQRILLAHNEVGVTEEKNPDRIYEYQKAVGIGKTAPWCAAFQYWVFQQAAGIYNPMPRTGLANGIYNYAVKRGLRIPYKAEVGDYIVWKTANGYTGHIGLIIYVSKTYVKTIEGNTGSASVRTGGMVAIKYRSVTNPIGRLKVRGLVKYGNI